MPRSCAIQAVRRRGIARCFRRGDSMDLLNLGTAIAVIMKTVGRNSAAFQAYLHCHLSGESDTKAVLRQIRNLTHSESENEQTAETPCRLRPSDRD